MFSLRLYIWAGLAAAGIGLLGFIGRQIYNAGYNAAVLKEQERAVQLREAAKAFDDKVAVRIAAIRVMHTTVHQRLQKEVRENVIYRECIASDRVLSLTNAAITGTPVSADTGVVHTANPAE